MHACQACLSYSLIMRVCFRITLAVVFLSVKVIIMHITLQEEEEEEGKIVYSVIHSTLYIWFILIHMKSNYKLEHKTIYFLGLFFISLKKKYTLYQDKK